MAKVNISTTEEAIEGFSHDNERLEFPEINQRIHVPAKNIAGIDNQEFTGTIIDIGVSYAGIRRVTCSVKGPRIVRGVFFEESSGHFGYEYGDQFFHIKCVKYL